MRIYVAVNQMIQERDERLIVVEGRIFRLCLAIYRVSEKFPEGEILKKRIRGLAGDIFSQIYCQKMSQTIDSLGALQKYLKLCQALNLSSPMNFIILRREYQSARESLAEIGDRQVAQAPNVKVDESEPEKKDMNPLLVRKKKAFSRKQLEIIDRKKQIVEMLKKDGKIIANDDVAREIGVARKTLNNALRELIDEGIVNKEGSFKDSEYYLAKK
ncbi:MAG: hypothetical protein COU81_02135 [Candidatus Portnoybacteria bacterium CG10_big_fil_rev_8_21_14_0_10_36_7]|uniref:HTH deoR-type domain-containing protein n=1 Tax=Candidatus Portnoybacteria bacterium CG10_big_fil_rev_8_21_14_0_10_36_7 TaxID=1974812 RepID=A0A2M8KE44_9BACT|nr:MAG: hypothetical protein COU81_02135 [Candidatus Portnoybacteria bacterium CG10_big_fil_rev_8_21_14_0_10_36_7]